MPEEKKEQKPSQVDRYKRQRDEALALIEKQGRQIDRLLSKFGENDSAAPKQEAAAAPKRKLAGATDAELQAYVESESASDSLKALAYAEQGARDAERIGAQSRDAALEAVMRHLKKEEQVKEIKGVIAEQFGDEALNPRTELGALVAQNVKAFRESHGDGIIGEHPVYLYTAAQLAHRTLKEAAEIPEADSDGGGEDQDTTLEMASRSKSGPPPDERSAGMTDALVSATSTNAITKGKEGVRAAFRQAAANMLGNRAQAR